MSRFRLDIERIADYGNNRSENYSPKRKPRPPSVPENPKWSILALRRLT